METTVSMLAWRAENERIVEPAITPDEVVRMIFERFGSCIIGGCEVRDVGIGSGIVALAGIEDGKRVFRIVRFAGLDSVACFPVYLALRGKAVTVHASHPGLPCLRIDRDGGRDFIDALWEYAT